MLDFLREAWFLYLLATAALAWVAFADHPTAKNLRTAIADSLGL
jgi:hypothetical protein